MSAGAVPKDSGKKSKSKHTKSRQQPQQSHIVTHPSITAQPAFQLDDNYNEWFPPLGESLTSQVSSSNRHFVEVCIVVVVVFSKFYLFLFFVF
jgi:hypothetical protein